MQQPFSSSTCKSFWFLSKNVFPKAEYVLCTSAAYPPVFVVIIIILLHFSADLLWSSSLNVVFSPQFKSKMQIQIIRAKSGEPVMYKNVFHAAYVIVRTHGIRGAYQGLPATWLRNIPANSAFFGEFKYTLSLGERIPTIRHNISQHCWLSICKLPPNDRNISTQHIAGNVVVHDMLSVLGHPVMTCYRMLVIENWNSAHARA